MPYYEYNDNLDATPDTAPQQESIAVAPCLVTDIQELLPTIKRMNEQYTTDISEPPEGYGFAGNIASNPLSPAFAKFAILQSQGYPVIINRHSYKSEEGVMDDHGKAESDYDPETVAEYSVFIEDSSEAWDIMISPEAYPEDDQPPYAGVIGMLVDSWNGDDLPAKYILGERYTYYELCRMHEDKTPKEWTDDGVDGDRADPALLALKAADHYKPDELAEIWQKLLPDMVLPDGTHDTESAELMYKRLFMTSVLIYMTDEERDSLSVFSGMEFAAEELYHIDENWRVYDNLRSEGIQPLGYEQMYGIVSMQIRFAQDKLAEGFVPLLDWEYIR